MSTTRHPKRAERWTPRTGWGLCALGLAAVACQAPAEETPSLPLESNLIPDAPAAMSTADTAGESIWVFLLAKYDADANGAVSREEYTRDDASFARLDRDADGTLTAPDFDGPMGMDPEEVRVMLSRMMIVSLFELDGDESQLHIGELEEGIGLLDSNFDGGIDDAELEALAATKVDLSDTIFGIMKGQVGDASPYETLVAVLDENGDEQIVREEWYSFFFAHADPDDEYVWSQESDDPSGAPPSGVAEGEPAPDFSLRSPDGGDPVQLASFKDDRPVALIFGSYT